METGQPDDGPTPEWRSAMIDVSESTLAELVTRDDSVLDRCLRRLAGDLGGPSEQIAGFNSAL
ncbi:FxSxx-COOH cyclophane-containing RiPP peptide [Actinoplanes sp. HUAS TT8]|uniref:FxSxx-COOH cyclophane-containing RiPP peptide n=1 Tax=Actinoplanes sp. HUAS TT8 TaxID=3447453 RepID=UPI003F523131